MSNVSPNKTAGREATLARACRALLALTAALFVSAATAQAAFAAETARQSGRIPQQQTQQARPAEDDEDEGDDEEGGAGEGAAAAAPPQSADIGATLRKARFIMVRSDSAFVSGREVEASLLKRKEFKAWGMSITRNEAQADLIIEITRRPLTRRFTFSVVDPRTLEVVASGKTRSVLFGKKISNKIAEKFANRVKVYRPYQ